MDKYRFRFLRTSNVYHRAYIGPMEPQVIKSQESNIIQIPVRIRYDLLNWLYFKSGLTFDFQLSTDLHQHHSRNISHLLIELS